MSNPTNCLAVFEAHCSSYIAQCPVNELWYLIVLMKEKLSRFCVLVCLCLKIDEPCIELIYSWIGKHHGTCKAIGA